MDPKCAEFVRLLNESGWLQARVARELALNPSTVSLCVSGQTVPSLTVLRLFAGLIGQRLLIPGEGGESRFMKDGPRYLETWEDEALMALRRLDPAARKRVIDSVTEMIDAIGSSGRRRPPQIRHPEDAITESERIVAEKAAALFASDKSPGAVVRPPGGAHGRANAGADTPPSSRARRVRSPQNPTSSGA